MMRVAIVSPYDPSPYDATTGLRGDPRGLRGGVEEALWGAAVGLVGRGHDVTVVASARRAGKSVTPEGVRMVRVRRLGSVLRAPIAAFARHVPPDAEVVHVPGTYPLISDLVPLREAARRRPVVVEHHFDVHGPTALVRGLAAVHRATLGMGVRAATRVVAKSAEYAAASPGLRGVAQDRIDIVPNGVDVDEFRVGGAREEFVLCVGRLVPYKGVDVLVRAMPHVHRVTGLRLVVAGDGPERGRLAALAARVDAPVELVGRVPRASLVEMYARARVTVLPSVDRQEAFGIALLESMAAGTPVVASDLPGVRGVARLGGLLAPPGDPLALADMIVRLYADASLMGGPHELRRRVAEGFSWPVVVRRLEDVYRKAMEARPVARGRVAMARSRSGSGPA